MFNAKEAVDLRHNAISDIVEEVEGVVDDILKDSILSIYDGSSKSIRLNFIIREHFRPADGTQINYTYHQMQLGRMDVAEKIADRYRQAGWTVEVADCGDDDLESEVDPVITFTLSDADKNRVANRDRI